MGGDRERMEWNLNRTDTRAAAARRARIHRWSVPGRARVTHPAHGSVVVPHCSNLAAILNAAEVWGCNWVESWTRKCGPHRGNRQSPCLHYINKEAEKC